MSQLTSEEKRELAKLLAERDKRIRENQLRQYNPYPFQKKFHKNGKTHSQRLLMAGNRVGKTRCAAYEVAMHATGQYPDWWKGLRFTRPVRIIAAGQRTERTRDIVQKELLGPPADPTALGTGAIPKACIVDTTRKPGIPNAVASVVVKHKSGGNSIINIQSYEAGKEAWMGDSAHFVWLDEEPPSEIFSQALRAIVDVAGNLILTFTPENGLTDIVRRFLMDKQKHQFVMHATWDDAPHITAKVKREMLASMSPHERDMRMKGIPTIGSGLVFPVREEDITCDGFEVPPYWRRISGIDFGYDHPTAWVSVAHDPESDVVYIIDAVRVSQTIIPQVAMQLKKRGADRIPVAWPHDGLKHDSNSGRIIRDLYADEGLNMLPDKFSNPPSPGMPEGSGGIGIEAGIMAMHSRMETGKLKVFKHLQEWFEEFRLYHRKNGKIVDKNDDLMSATRYAVQSLRFALPIERKFHTYVPDPKEYCDEVVAY